MLGRFRSALYNAIGSIEAEPGSPLHPSEPEAAQAQVLPKVKYAYQRPIFLQMFTEDEIQVTADHGIRPIIVPRDFQILPWFTGYAEAINAGKSVRNEDQAAFHRGVLRTQDLNEEIEQHFEIPYVYFGIFDGHAGSATAVTAANDLHQIVHKRLMGVLKHLGQQQLHNGSQPMWFPSREISLESMVIGALESAFWEADQLIGEDKKRYKMQGGCTVLVAVFILGKLYVANAGDSRAVLCREKAAYPMSFDFTPVSERQRLQQLGYQKPHLLGNEYTHLDYCRRPLRKDLGKPLLYRDAHMTGWAYKEIQPEDLKFPVVYGEGKRSRLLATIGVTRGFGDHDLRAQSASSNPVYIKPFLTPQPEVRVLDVEQEDISEADVLVMGTDGLWDVLPNDRVAEIVHNGLCTPRKEDDQLKQRYRHITIAQDLVMAARGKLVDRNWKRNVGVNGEQVAATIDDISVFVIPIVAYKKEYLSWKAEKLAKTKETPFDIETFEAEINQDLQNAESSAVTVEEGVDAMVHQETSQNQSSDEQEESAEGDR